MKRTLQLVVERKVIYRERRVITRDIDEGEHIEDTQVVEQALRDCSDGEYPENETAVVAHDSGHHTYWVRQTYPVVEDTSVVSATVTSHLPLPVKA